MVISCKISLLKIMRLIDADEFSRIFDGSAIGKVCDEHAELETAGVNNV